MKCDGNNVNGWTSFKEVWSQRGSGYLHNGKQQTRQAAMQNMQQDA